MAPASRPARRRRSRWGIETFGRVLYIGLFLVFLLAPFYWVVITSIKPVDDYLAIPPVWFPDAPTTGHYTAALFTYRGLDGLINSAVVSSITRSPSPRA